MPVWGSGNSTPVHQHTDWGPLCPDTLCQQAHYVRGGRPLCSAHYVMGPITSAGLIMSVQLLIFVILRAFTYCIPLFSGNCMEEAGKFKKIYIFCIVYPFFLCAKTAVNQNPLPTNQIEMSDRERTYLAPFSLTSFDKHASYFVRCLIYSEAADCCGSHEALRRPMQFGGVGAVSHVQSQYLFVPTSHTGPTCMTRDSPDSSPTRVL